MMNTRRLFLLTALITTVAISGLVVAATTSTNIANNNNNYYYATAQSSSQNQTTSSQRGHLVADLTGQGVPGPVNRQTDASGKAVFTLVGDGNTMSYVINASNLDDVQNILLSASTGGRVRDLVQIHSAVTQGPLQTINGTLALQGNFTSANFIDVLNGKQMSDLLKMMLDGNVYVKMTSSAMPLGEIGGKLTAAALQ
ncbi:MAG TPA: CHRD domain-containing protein [Nitrososphaeraceae archaeon]